jgi:hypothetical protein
MRFDGIKNKDEKTVTAVLDESYSKFDDWPSLSDTAACISPAERVHRIQSALQLYV